MAASTGAGTSAESSTRWRPDARPRLGSTPIPGPLSSDPGRLAPEDADRVLRALRVCYSVVLPRMIRAEARARLGVRAPSYARSAVFSGEYVHALAAELGEWWWRIVRDAELAAPDAGLRVERSHQEDAVAELVTVIRSFPRPVRDVVERRGMGLSMRAIAADLPDRAYFSVEDDWRVAARHVHDRHGDLVRRLT